MENVEATPRAVVYSALLHLGIVAFLALAMLNCTRWEDVANALRLPDALRPVTCTRMLQLQGPVIEATLVGPVGAPPPPRNTRQKRQPNKNKKPRSKPNPRRPRRFECCRSRCRNPN